VWKPCIHYLMDRRFKRQHLLLHSDIFMTFKGVVHSFFFKLLLIIYSPPCHPRFPCHSFFRRKEIKVFEINIPGFFSIQCTLLVTKRFKVQKQFPGKLKTVQRALNDSRRWIRVLSSETIAHLKKKKKFKFKFHKLK